MTIIKKEKKGNITVYTVKKNFDDAKMATMVSKFVQPSMIDLVLKEDADVYTEEGQLLLKFRKNILPKGDIDIFYDNIYAFASLETSNRGMAGGGSKKKSLATNKPIKSNIFGYFDSWTPSHKIKFGKLGIKAPLGVRECRFNQTWPEKYQETIPLIQEIDHLYEKLTPDHYALQKKKANQTPFHIANTSFTTITTNMNFRTAIHTDKGDDPEGFGNLAVIQRGSYKGGETCFPQYGIGVDLRTGDILFMDVHQPHGNLPMTDKSPDAIRLSIVCYLRTRIWERTKGKTRKFMERHNRTIKKMFGK
jgi:hypothetical protein